MRTVLARSLAATIRIDYNSPGENLMKNLVSFAVCAAIASSSALAADFGQKVEQLAKSQTLSLFGTLGALGASSLNSLSAADANANPAALLTVAPGLSVRVVSAASNLSPNLDQMTVYPATNPTHIIGCNEQGTGQVAVQRINLTTGVAENIIASGSASRPGARSSRAKRMVPAHAYSRF